jgi:hypothetical protein
MPKQKQSSKKEIELEQRAAFLEPGKDNEKKEEWTCIGVYPPDFSYLEEKANELLYSELKKSNKVVYVNMQEKEWVSTHIESFKKAYKSVPRDYKNVFLDIQECFDKWLAERKVSIEINPTYRASIIANFENWSKVYEKRNKHNQNQT